MPSGVRPPIPPGYARVAITGTLLTKPWVMIFYLQLTGSSITTADLNTLAGDIGTAWNTNCAGQVTSDVVSTGCTIVYVPSVGNELVGTSTFSHGGSGGGTTVADVSACYVVNWHINAYYRGGHPRSYVPGVITGNVTNGSGITGGAQSSVTSAYTNFLTAVNGYTTTNISAASMGTMSFQSGNAWRGTPLFRKYQSVSVRALLGSQRRRIKA